MLSWFLSGLFAVMSILILVFSIKLWQSSYAVLVSRDVQAETVSMAHVPGSSTHRPYSDEYVYKVVYQVQGQPESRLLDLEEDKTILFKVSFAVTGAEWIFRRHTDETFQRVVAARVSEDDCAELLSTITCEMAAAGVEVNPSGKQQLSIDGTATWSIQGLDVREYKCTILARITKGKENKIAYARGPEDQQIERCIEFKMPSDEDLRFGIHVRRPIFVTLRRIGAVLGAILASLAASVAVLEFTAKRLTRSSSGLSSVVPETVVNGDN